MAVNFRYSLDNVTWNDVPDYAHPDDKGSVRILYPKSRGYNGLMLPAQVVGPKRFQLTSPTMIGTGWNWWQALFGTDATAENKTLYLKVFNERRTDAWHNYQVTIFRPQGQLVSHGTSAATAVWGSIRIDGVVLAELD